MEKLDFYKKRIESAIDEGMVDYKKEGQFRELVEKVIYGPHRYPRLVAALSLVKELMPEALSRPLVKKLDKKDFSQLPFDPEKLELRLNGQLLFRGATPTDFSEREVSDSMRSNRETLIELHFGEGSAEARFWTSDLTEEYVRLNADYRT